MYLGEKFIEMESLSVGDLRIRLQKDHAKNYHKKHQYSGFLIRVICDYIAGMTDDYAIKEYKELYE